ncbi:MAG: HD-GYP domain-containing protein [candidate division Zixibacteria bacterium]|nr:HD-GYP domain-containing protein [candidate division Zixibacteria bacterium]
MSDFTDIFDIAGELKVGFETAINTDDFLTIHLESLRLNSVLQFDLYIHNGADIILYRNALLPFTEKNRETLLENNIRQLYVPVSMRGLYQSYIETNIKAILDDPVVDDRVKASIVYDSANSLVREVLSKPTLGENIKRSQHLVENTVSFILSKKSAFYNLLKVMSFDYYTYSHSVNVCTFSLALARYIGIDDIDELNILGTGALLHDVGKIRIDEAILNKKEPLTEEEVDIIQMHPYWGYEILQETDLLSAVSYYPIVQHHEREDRSGYPRKLGADEIHLYSKIVAIADVFDAMTTRRVYRSAIEPYPALKEMFENRKAFNIHLLEQFTLMMGPGSADNR